MRASKEAIIRELIQQRNELANELAFAMAELATMKDSINDASEEPASEITDEDMMGRNMQAEAPMPRIVKFTE